MADNDVEVGVDIETTGLQEGIRPLITGFEQLDATILKMSADLRLSANSIEPLRKQIKELEADLGRLGKSGNDAIRLQLEGLIKNSQQTYAGNSRLITGTTEEVRNNQLARAGVRERLEDSVSPSGRTYGEARQTDQTIRAVITEINTRSDQAAARIADAAGKAAERLVRSSEAALEARFNQTNRSTLQNLARDQVPGLTGASVVGAQVRALNTVARYGGHDSGAEFLKAQQAETNRRYLQGVRDRSMDEERKAEEKAEKERRDKARAEEKQARRDYSRSDEGIREKVGQNAKYRDEMLNYNGGADFFAFQSRLAANYMIFATAVNAIQSGLTQIATFDDTLTKFAAITQTSNTELVGFRKNLLELGQTSRYSVVELAEVSVQLGQIGLSAADVGKTLPAVMNLASASGSTLAQSVNLITAAMGAFNMAAGQANNIADIFTGTLNASRLNVEQLGAAIQYAGTISSQMGISLSELSAAAGGIAQSGVQSGSTIGTGLRQLIEELTAPSENLLKTFKQLGISLSDIDIKTNTLVGVLENLRAKGFDTETALRALDLRAASSFAALINQTDRTKRLQEQILLTNSATEGADRANQSLIASLNRLGNSLFAVVDNGFSPLISTAVKATDVVAGFFGALSNLGPVLPIITGSITALAAALAAVKITSLLGGLGSLIGAGGLLSGPVALGVMGGAGVAALAVYLSTLGDAGQKAKEGLDKARAAQNELVSAATTNETNIKNVEDRISQLQIRREKLNNDPILLRTTIIEAQKSFGDLGLSIDMNAKSIDDLIEAYRRLNNQIKDNNAGNASQQVVANTRSLEALQEQQRVNSRSLRGRTTQAVTGRNVEYDENMTANYMRKTGLGELTDIIGFLRNGIDSADPSGPATGGMNQRINDMRQRILTERNALPVGSDGAKLYDDQLDTLTRLQNLLKEEVAVRSNILAEQKKLDNSKIDSRRVEITRQFDSISEQRSALTAQLRTESLKVTEDKSLSPVQQVDAVRDVIRRTQETAKGLLSDLDKQSAQMIADGASSDDVKEATHGLRDAISSLLKGTSKEIVDLQKSMAPEATAMYQRQRRAVDATINDLSRQAGNARSQEDVANIEAFAKQKFNELNEIERKLIELKTANPDDVYKNASLIGELEASRDEVRGKLQAFQERIVDARRRIVDRELAFQNRALENAKDYNLAEASRLEKILKDARTTPEKAEQLIAEINKFLESARNIAQQQNQIQGQQGLNKVESNSMLPNITSAPSGSVANQIIETLKQRGKSDQWTNYFLGSGDRESSLNPNARNPSGATGLFQFMPKTWQQYGSGNILDVANQINAMIKFTEDNANSFQKEFGREATAAELYLMHQQGGAGGRALIRNPMASASSIVGSAAVTQNGGDATWTGQQFANHVMRQFTTSLDRVAGRYTTTPREIENQATADRGAKIDADTQRRQEENKKELAEKIRQQDLRRLQIGDKAIDGELELQQSLQRRATTTEAATAASQKSISLINQLAGRKIDEDLLRNTGRSEDGNVDAAARIREDYRKAAEKQVIEGAEAVGRTTLLAYRQEVDRLKALLDSYKLPGNEGKVSQSQIDLTQEQLNKAQETLRVDGEYAQNKSKILEFERGIAQLRGLDIGNGQQLVSLEEKLTELKQRQAGLQPQITNKARLEGSSSSIGTALDNGVTDFMKSRGIVGSNGLADMTNDALQARKTMSEALGAISGSFDQFFTGIFSGTKDAKTAFKDFATSILNNLAQLASKALTNEIFKMFLGASTGAGDSGGGFLGSIMSMFGGGGGGAGPITDFVNMNNGGSVPLRFAAGGSVPNYLGVQTRDSVPAYLRPGEVVMRNSAVETIGRDKLEAMNALGSTVINNTENKIQPIEMNREGASAEANVYILSPDQKPIPGPKDIVFAITDDIQRGGAVRQLIKQVKAS